MNKRKGFFRLTLVLSFLFGIMTLCFSDNIFKVSPFRESEHRTVKIRLPSDWGDKTLQEKLYMIDELDTKMRDWETKRIQEEEEKRKRAAEERKKIAEEWEKAGLDPLIPLMRRTIGEPEKINKERKKRGLPPLPLLDIDLVIDLQSLRLGIADIDYIDYIDYYKLSSKEKLNVKKQIRIEIISNEKEKLKDRGRRNYYVSLGPDWKKISFLLLTIFTIGFTPVWLIYGFTRWVIIAFIVGGFKGKSPKGGEPD